MEFGISRMCSIFMLIIIMILGVHGNDHAEFLRALRSEDNAELLNLIANFTDKDELKNHLDYLLPIACERRQSNTALLLLEKGADPNVTTSVDGLTPLMISSRYGLYTVCVALVDKGANLEATDSTGNTALIYAILNEQDGIVKYLTDKGARPNIVTLEKNRIPLHYACITRNPNVIRILIEKGADMNVKDSSGWTPLSIACRERFESGAEILIEKGANVNLTDGFGKSPLIWAAKFGLTNIVNRIIEKKVDINFKDMELKTALTHACLENRIDIATILINHGSDVNTVDEEGKTPLMYAAKNGNVDVLNYLLKNGAHVNDADKNGNTALLLATFASDMNEDYVLDVVEILLGSGADIDVRNREGLTALEKATAKGSKKIIDLIKKVELRNELAKMKSQFQLMLQTEKEELTKNITDINSKLDRVMNEFKELRDWITSKGLRK